MGSVNCVDEHLVLDCEAQRSCVWTNHTGLVGDAPGNSSDAACKFNPEVEPNMGIGGTMGVNQTAQGVLAGAFMGGYCVFSPIFAYLASTDISPFSIVGVGARLTPERFPVGMTLKNRKTPTTTLQRFLSKRCILCDI